MNRISVIIPVYNVAEYLPRCLNSVLAQTYTDIEIIAVDDGSLDNSDKILDQYAQKHDNLHVIHQKNSGVTSARLRGVEASTGEWIGFVDGDDEVEPDMYARLLENAVKYKSDISHCGYQMCFSDGRVHYFHNTGLLAKHDKTTALRELLSGSMIEPGLCNKLFNKTLFHSLLHSEIIDTSVKINEDLLMNFYLFSLSESSVFEDWCPYHYIVRKHSASRAKLNEHKIYDPIKVKKIILEKCCQENTTDAQKAFMTTCVYTYCGLLMERNTKTYRNSVRNELILNYEWIELLPKRTKLLAKLAIHAPIILGVVYPIYANLFQSKKYD